MNLSHSDQTKAKVHPECRPFYFQRGTEAVLLVHGFTGSPKEMAPLGDYLQKRGYTVLGIRLKGHGISVQAMAKTGWADWVHSAQAGLTKLQSKSSRVHLCGLSLGGAICLYLASNQNVASVTTLAAPVMLLDWRLKLLPIAKRLMRFVPVIGESDLVNKEAEQELWHYEQVPLVCVDSLVAFLKEVRLSLPQIRAPLFVAHGDHDKTVDPRNAKIIYLESGASHKVKKMYHSGHGMTVDADREKLFSDIAAFLDSPRRFA